MRAAQPHREQIPQMFEDAALIDELSRFGTLRRIILPLAMPGMVVAAQIPATQRRPSAP
jgi:ABC-type glycerol-3-phosphate transport system permease component